MEACAASGLPKALALSFAQVGDDVGASKFLDELDNDAEIGDRIDTVGDYEAEAARLAAAHPLSPYRYLMKLALGAIDHRYDELD